MKILMTHPNGDIHAYDTDNPDSMQDFISDLEFEMNEGGADWVGVCRRDLSKAKQVVLFDRVSRKLVLNA